MNTLRIAATSEEAAEGCRICKN